MASQLSNPWWVFVLLGICAGLISGTLGLGSGTVLVPAFVLLCAFGQKSAQGMSLAVMVPMALVGALRYWKNPGIEIDLAVVGLVTIGALAGALAGTELAGRLPGHVLRKAFAVFLVIAAAKMFFAARQPGQPLNDNDLQQQQKITSVENDKNEPAK
ncbi:MAG: sulfite exporter TauE/SafE family protein [Planctomycetota bacterium]|jgi:uncharacterized membrane protein YfcA